MRENENFKVISINPEMNINGLCYKIKIGIKVEHDITLSFRNLTFNLRNIQNENNLPTIHKINSFESEHIIELFPKKKSVFSEDKCIIFDNYNGETLSAIFKENQYFICKS